MLLRQSALVERVGLIYIIINTHVDTCIEYINTGNFFHFDTFGTPYKNCVCAFTMNIHVPSQIGVCPSKEPVILLSLPVQVLELLPTRENPVSQM